MQYILQSHPARENQVTEDFEAMMAEETSMPVQNIPL
jgi:hypothetical protein